MHPAPIGGGIPAKAGNSGENLPLLYQELLTGVVRLKGERQHLTDAEPLRRRTKGRLQEIERVAVAGGYDNRDVRDTHFAVVAFLDETIQHSNDPARAEWVRRPLAQELFGQADAGVVFFGKLEEFRSRRDSEQLADILEVYLLCLLLGFEGRYAGKRGELEGLMDSVRMRVEHIRGRADQISPSASLPPASAPLAAVRRRNSRLPLVTLCLIVFTLVLFLILRYDLISKGEELRKLF